MKLKQTMTRVGMVVGATMIAGTALAALPQEAKDAIADNDFTAFQAAVVDTRAANIPEEVFDLKADLYDAREAEDEDEVESIKAELKEYKEDKKAEHDANKEVRHDAIESGDYDAFVETVPEGKDVPSEVVFELIIDLHDAKDAEDQDAIAEAKEALSDAGFERPDHKKGPRGSDREGGERPQRGNR